MNKIISTELIQGGRILSSSVLSDLYNVNKTYIRFEVIDERSMTCGIEV